MTILIIRINNDKNGKANNENDNNMIQKYKQKTRTKLDISKDITFVKDYKNLTI
jgi:hypothetical protein